MKKNNMYIYNIMFNIQVGHCNHDQMKSLEQECSLNVLCGFAESLNIINSDKREEEEEEEEETSGVRGFPRGLLFRLRPPGDSVKYEEVSSWRSLLPAPPGASGPEPFQTLMCANESANIRLQTN